MIPVQKRLPYEKIRRRRHIARCKNDGDENIYRRRVRVVNMTCDKCCVAVGDVTDAVVGAPNNVRRDTCAVRIGICVEELLLVFNK